MMLINFYLLVLFFIVANLILDNDSDNDGMAFALPSGGGGLMGGGGKKEEKKEKEPEIKPITVLNYGGNKTVIEAPDPIEPDPFFASFERQQTRKTDQAEFANWENNLANYQKDIGNIQAGRTGWDDFKTNLTSRLNRGIVSYDQAVSEVDNYVGKYDLTASNLTGPGADPRQYWEKWDKDAEQFNPTYTAEEFAAIDKTPTTWSDAGSDWETFTPDTFKSSLSDLYYGTGGGTTGGTGGGTTGGTGGILYNKNVTGATNAFKNLWGRDADQDELAEIQDYFSGAPTASVSDWQTTEMNSLDYKQEFNRSYLNNYYDTQYGDNIRDADGNRTDDYKFDYGGNLLPSYTDGEEGKTNLANLTGITVGDFSSGSFTGTPEEIQQHLTNINQTRDYLFKSGLTNLQGTIDKEIQTLKNEGTKEITKIAKEGDIYQSLVGSFNFS